MTLYLICPFSQSENYIRSTIDSKAYFLTANGGLFNLHENEFPHTLQHVAENCSLERIVQVQHLDSPFLNMVMERNHDALHDIQNKLVEIYLSNYRRFSNTTLGKKAFAYHILTHQMAEMTKHSLVTHLLRKHEITLQSLIIQGNSHEFIHDIQHVPYYAR
jgi:hypothetical protein